MEIIELSQRPALLEVAVDYFWKCWGNEQNRIFYKDCMMHSMDATKTLPKFYMALEAEQIIGSYALLTNDLISRQDLMPWLGCLFVNEDRRNQGIAEKLLEHGLQQTKLKGFEALYLSSDLEGFYEKKSWQYLAKGYGFSGGEIKIYTKKVD